MTDEVGQCNGKNWRDKKRVEHHKALWWHKRVNKCITEAAEAGDPLSLLGVIGQHLQDMNSINLVTALHRVAKLCVHNGSKENEPVLSHETFQSLFHEVERRIVDHGLTRGGAMASADEMPVQCMSVVAWSCATLRLRGTAIFDVINDIASTRLHEFQPFELAQLLQSFAKMGHPHRDIFTAGARHIINRQSGEFKSLCLSMIAWSFACANVDQPFLYASLGDEILAQAHEMKAQEISNTLWAFAKANAATPQLYTALGNSAISRNKIASFRPQDLSNSLWGFATARIHHPMFFKEATRVILDKSRMFLPQHLANICWAYARVEAEDAKVLAAAFLETASNKLPQFRPEDLAVLLQEVGALGLLGDRTFLGALGTNCPKRLLDGTLTAMPAKTLASLGVACCSFADRPPRGLDVVLAEVCNNIKGRAAQVDANDYADLVLAALAAASRKVADSPVRAHLASLLAIASACLSAKVTDLTYDGLRVLSKALENAWLGPQISELVQPLWMAIERAGRAGSVSTSSFAALQGQGEKVPRFDSQATSFGSSATSFGSAWGGSAIETSWEDEAPSDIVGSCVSIGENLGEAVAPSSSLAMAIGMFERPAAPAVRTLAEHMADLEARGLCISYVEAASLVLDIVTNITPLMQQYGRRGLCTLQCDRVLVQGGSHGQRHVEFAGFVHDPKAHSTTDNFKWLSPEEAAAGLIDMDIDLWSAASFRVGLLLHSMLGAGAPVRSPDGDTAWPAQADGRGSWPQWVKPRCPALMLDLMADCLRTKGQIRAPQLTLVESTLAILAMEVRQMPHISVHCSSASAEYL
mmetsp:Transcript_1213/g.3266  ORF Transcript_1213/g.3266 Transcript_1213/m.3266 type:complete len:813 (-) Transcript_1213:148-2586(-)